MANVCFGCNDVEDIKVCPKKECPHYYHRNSHLKMDDIVNDERDRMVKRTWKLVQGL